MAAKTEGASVKSLELTVKQRHRGSGSYRSRSAASSLKSCR